MTLMKDLDRGAILLVGNGKSAESLVPFWKRLWRRRHRIEALAMDMSSAYISAVGVNLPKSDIVLDRVHVLKLMNENLTTLRRQLFREATDEEKLLLKGKSLVAAEEPRESV